MMRLRRDHTANSATVPCSLSPALRTFNMRHWALVWPRWPQGSEHAMANMTHWHSWPTLQSHLGFLKSCTQDRHELKDPMVVHIPSRGASPLARSAALASLVPTADKDAFESMPGSGRPEPSPTSFGWRTRAATAIS